MINRLKEIRNSLGLTQTEFAKSVHLTPQSISMIESGKRPVTDRLIHNICTEFGVSEEWLRTGEGDMFPPLDESEDDLIEAIGMICSDNVDPVRKVLARAAVQLMLEIPDDAIPAFRKFIAEAHKGIESSENKNAEE